MTQARAPWASFSGAAIAHALRFEHAIAAREQKRNTTSTRRANLLLEEFNAIWNKQASDYPSMTAEARDAIHEAIFFQRPLKQPPVGKCSLDPAKDKDDVEGYRCPWAHPLAQRFRIWQEVRNLRVVETGKPEHPLGKEEGDKIALGPHPEWQALFRQDSRHSETAARDTVQS